MYNESHRFYHGTTRIPSQRGENVVNIEVGPLHSVIAPEEKRKIIGDTFMKVKFDANSVVDFSSTKLVKTSKQTFSCSKLTIETIEKGVAYV